MATLKQDLARLAREERRKLEELLDRDWLAWQEWLGEYLGWAENALKVGWIIAVAYAALAVWDTIASVSLLSKPDLSGGTIVLWAVLIALTLAIMLWCCMKFFVKTRVVAEWAAALETRYLCSFTLREVFEKRLFNRLAVYTDRGFCYEAAALNMFALKNNRTARYVIAQTSEGVHAFVEFRRFGLWWAIDPNWQYVMVQSRLWHKLRLKARYERIISHEEFWSWPLSQDFDRKLSRRETSWLLMQLVMYHKPSADGWPMNFEIHGLKNTISSGENWDHRFNTVMGEDCPITYRMVMQFMARPLRRLPKRKTYRRAMALEKRMRQIRREEPA